MENYFKYYPERDMIINKIVLKKHGVSFWNFLDLIPLDFETENKPKKTI